jgi:hypothetical protein
MEGGTKRARARDAAVLSVFCKMQKTARKMHELPGLLCESGDAIPHSAEKPCVWGGNLAILAMVLWPGGSLGSDEIVLL